jgi:Lipase (class 3)
MAYIGSARIPGNSLFLAKCIALLRQPMPEDLIRQAVANEFNFAASTAFVPGDDVSSACCWVKCLDYLFLFCDGIANFGQGSGTWNGYTGGITADRTNPTNDYFNSAAAKIQAAMSPYFNSEVNNRVFCGWSLGGCEAMQVALNGILQGLWGMPDIATFGSPRFGCTAICRNFDARRIVRWMTDTDPVTLLPPRVGDMPILPAIYGVNATIRMGNFVHAPGGVAIDVNGNMANAETAPLAPSAFPLQIGSWLIGADASDGSPHFIGTYASRLQLWMDNHPPNNPPTRGFEPIEKTGQVSGATLSQQARAQETALFVNAAIQEQAVQAVPPDLLFKAVRINRLWYVTMGGSVVSIAPNKRRARGFANAGNDFLRRTLREGYVDTDQLTNSMRGWLTAAQDPTSGITPLISASLP